MKYLFSLSIMLMMTLCMKAQEVTINETPLSEIDVEFIQILGTSKMFSNKVTVEVDFGQHQKFFSSGKENDVYDKDGKRVDFNSMIDALNFFASNGYEFVQAYAFNTGGNQNVYHYLMRKKD